MPIKFACEHCGQVLSVSSTKAGKGAKCPKCHQGITVPTAETAAATLARRKQLPGVVATEKKTSAEAKPTVASPPAAPPSPVAISPIPASPIATESSAKSANAAPLVAIPPEIAVPQPPPAPVESLSNSLTATEPGSSQVAPPTGTAPPEVDEADPFTQFTVYDDGAELVYAAEENDTYDASAEIDRDSLAVPRGVLYLQGALLGVVALICFTLGVLVGGATMSGGTSNGPRVAKPCSVSGSVVFRDRRKESSPDDGSVVIFLPQDARPDEKTPIIGLRPDDPTPDNDHAALTAIRSLGGGYARADSEGRFNLRVADTGTYFVLVISRNGKRKAGETFKTADLAQLGRYFADVTDLIGENRYRWKVERISGDRMLSEEFN